MAFFIIPNSITFHGKNQHHAQLRLNVSASVV